MHFHPLWTLFSDRASLWVSYCSLSPNLKSMHSRGMITSDVGEKCIFTRSGPFSPTKLHSPNLQSVHSYGLITFYIGEKCMLPCNKPFFSAGLLPKHALPPNFRRLFLHFAKNPPQHMTAEVLTTNISLKRKLTEKSRCQQRL